MDRPPFHREASESCKKAMAGHRSYYGLCHLRHDRPEFSAVLAGSSSQDVRALSCVDRRRGRKGRIVPEVDQSMMRSRTTGQGAARRRSANRLRVVVACLLAVAIALQALTSIGLPFRPRGEPNGDAALFASSASIACAKWRHGGGSGDTQHHLDDCCILCGGCDANCATALLALVDSEPVDAIGARSSRIPASAQVRPPAGWASAWSSRAPPHFS